MRPGDRRRHSKDNCCSVTVCVVLAMALCKNFPQMFSCLRPSDHRERDGMGHVCNDLCYNIQCEFALC